MKLILGYLGVFFILFLSCNNVKESKQSTEIDSVINQDTSVKTISSPSQKTSFVMEIDSTFPCQLQTPDSSVYGIFLSDAESTLKVIGEKYTLEEKDNEFPAVDYVSKDGKQVLKLIFFYGDSRHHFSEFEVKYSNKEKVKKLPTDVFKTGHGIKLGMTEKEIIKIIGECFKKEKKGKAIVLKYKLDSWGNSDFLNRYNIPVYHADYTFEEGKLVKFRFGFEYP